MLGLLAAWWRWHEDDPPFRVEQVVSMEAQLYNSPRDLPDIPTFTVPPEHIPAVLAALEPLVLDRQPAKWAVLGDLECVSVSGKRFRVNLYWTRAAVGAFSVGPPAGANRRYYRGGTDAGIEDAIRAAHAAAKK